MKRWSRPFEALSSYGLGLVATAGVVATAVAAADGQFGWPGIVVWLLTVRAIKILAFRAREFERLHSLESDHADPP